MPEVKFSDVRSFTLAVQTAGKAIPAKIMSQVQRKLMLTALRRVILRTPVDTGRARGNWQVTLWIPATTPLPNLDKSGRATEAQGFGVIASLVPYSRSFISNSLPYIGVLEYGLYPIPGEGPIRPRAFQFVTRKGKVVKARTSTRQRSIESARKVTSEGYSTQAPRGMVRLTFEELKVEVQSIQAGLAKLSLGGPQ